MKVKVILEGESEAEADEMLEKAFSKKHEHAHTEEFQDPLIEELLSDFDKEIKKIVFLGGFQEAIQILNSDAN